ncbi:unnamed protein product [Owenia fusiformis]|uniref:Uncharacterized protein n=1 Tax=Owenia fusiformis TaxID=6347 RepID=A0A8J1XR50_OWEFU|nr:unnamed protein product [Owenia fusiformis]
MKALGFLVVSLLLLALVHVAYTIADSHLNSPKDEVPVDKDNTDAGSEEKGGVFDEVSELDELSLAHSRRKDLRDFDSDSVLTETRSDILLVDPVSALSRKRTHRHIKGHHHHRHHHGLKDIQKDRWQAEEIQQGDSKQDNSHDKETTDDDRLIKPEDIMMGDQPVIDDLDVATDVDEDANVEQIEISDKKAQRKMKRKNEKKEMRKKKKEEKKIAKQGMKAQNKEAKKERKAKRKEEKKDKRKEAKIDMKEQRKAQRKEDKTEKNDEKLDTKKENRERKKEQRKADRKASKQNAKNKRKEEKAIKKEEKKAQRESKRREKKMQRKQEKLASLIVCETDADCNAGSCCIKKKAGMFCKAFDKDVDSRCKGHCQCKSGLTCFTEQKKWGRSKRFGQCKAPSNDVTTELPISYRP